MVFIIKPFLIKIALDLSPRNQMVSNCLVYKCQAYKIINWIIKINNWIY